MDTVFRSLASVVSSSSSSSSSLDFFRVEAEACPKLSRKFGVNMVPTCVLLSETNEVVDRVEGEDPARLTRAVNDLAASSSSSTSTTTLAAEPAPPPSLDDRLRTLVRASEVMLFMKGDVAKPRCGFSRRATEILTEANVPFGTFDILGDDEVRQGLKTFSDWPTYPQLYVRGALFGGLDVLQETAAEATDEGRSLAEALEVNEIPGAPTTLEDRLAALVKRSRVVLFIKGVPSAPRCGFSRRIVEILDEEKTSYDSFDVLEDEDVRQGLKTYSDWPTYPQLYVDGEFVGGLDVVKEMKESDELGELLRGETTEE